MGGRHASVGVRTITSTLLTLLVIPTVYELLDNFRTWVRAKFGLPAAHTGEHRVVPAPAQADHGRV